ncbi:MAG: AraC family transcriptional regulator [Lachnospiraceae bacterium]|nr:AraC family transcriptional regulator [Lachnospiraceae bacterium]
MILPCTVQTNRQGEELREHGTRLFPVACYLDVLPGDEIPWHWHNELELGLVVKGTADVELASVKYRLRAGDGFFINSNILHAVSLTEGDFCEIHSVVFHPRAVSGSTDNIIWQKYVKPLTENQGNPGFHLTPEIEWHRRALEGIAGIWRLAEQEDFGYEMYIRNELSMMTALFSEHQATVNKKSFGKEQRDNARIKEMLTFIQSNYDREVTIEDIASACAISASECIRCFRATINTTPIAYLKSYRLQQAALKLQLSSDKISAVAESCGFQEMSYFAKSFKEVYGCTPSEYRIGK